MVASGPPTTFWKACWGQPLTSSNLASAASPTWAYGSPGCSAAGAFAIFRLSWVQA